MTDDDPTMLVFRRRVRRARRWFGWVVSRFILGLAAGAVLALLIAYIGAAIKVYGARP